ncbi:MAG: hypothetical protein H0U76_28615 [Ktedonobacteraceae bacterium]|nr:hypothetical protein [Ktedonobacteraceae bacterium]
MNMLIRLRFLIVGAGGRYFPAWQRDGEELLTEMGKYLYFLNRWNTVLARVSCYAIVRVLSQGWTRVEQ